ncbi:hypothetical protein [Pleomorphomonas sp. PLEO]|uniref:hypothetical protein n=1 Tax=Pleomorphomonas sp. PLEO TaxID=3239306 RepID=UPI00351DFAC9
MSEYAFPKGVFDRGRAAFLLLTLAVTLLLAGCGTPPRTLFARFTMEVETPEGLRTVSTVAKYSIGPNDGFLAGLSMTEVYTMFWGEAAMVDLGDRGILFCTIGGDYERAHQSLALWDFALRLFPREGSKDQLAAHLDDLIRTHPKTTVSNAQLPLLIRFRDLADPMTAERIDPNDLEASFGSGVRIARSEFEILQTPELRWWQWFSPPPEIPITKAIQARLPWLSLPVEALDLKLARPKYFSLNAAKKVTDHLSAGSFIYPDSLREVREQTPTDTDH